MRFWQNTRLGLFLACGALLFSFGCASGSKEPSKDELGADQTDEAADVGKDEGDAVPDNTAQDVGAPENGTKENDLALNANQGNANLSDLNANQTAPAAKAPEAAPVETAPSHERVVRYVMKDNTPAYQKNDDKSPQTAVYQMGDPLVVDIQGDWAQIADGYSIQTSNLSSRIVPRKTNTNEWMHQKVSAR